MEQNSMEGRSGAHTPDPATEGPVAASDRGATATDGNVEKQVVRRRTKKRPGNEGRVVQELSLNASADALETAVLQALGTWQDPFLADPLDLHKKLGNEKPPGKQKDTKSEAAKAGGGAKT